MKKKIGIVSDSATGFSLEELKNYPDLTIIPLTIIDDENNKVYDDDNVDITGDGIYRAMINDGRVLKTSQTNREKLREYWQKALKKYDEILFLPIAQAASGQYDSACILQQEPEFKDRVTVYETGAASVPLKTMVLIALKLANQDKPLKEIIKALYQFRLGYECYLTPNNLSYLARGGRIPTSLSYVANFLKLKAVISCKEKIKSHKIKRTMNLAIKEMLDTIVEKTKSAVKETLYVLNAWCDKELLDKAIDKAKELGFKKIKIEPLCNILQTHTGNNTIGFAVVPNKYHIEV